LRSNDILGKKKLRNGKLTKSPKKKLTKLKDKKLKKPAVGRLNFDSIFSASKEKEDKSLNCKTSGDDISNSDSVDKCKHKEEVKPVAQTITAINDVEVNDAQTKVSNKRPATPTDENIAQPKKAKTEKSSPNRLINRGPASKRKQSSNIDNEDTNDLVEFEPETKSLKHNSQPPKDDAIHLDPNCIDDDKIGVNAEHDEKSDLLSTDETAIHKCAASLVKVFKQGGLLDASCGHCQEAGCYTPESMEIDIPGSLIIMECTVCNWTTVRRISVTNRLI